jgi:hypothetical protein
MKVSNIHERVLHASAEKVGALIDGLASAHDPLWPIDRWPPMQFDGPLGVGASGGHGPIRYVVESYSPGRSVQFRFLAPKGFLGIHRFEIEPIDGKATMLRHVIDMQASGRTWLVWALAIRPLHDALMEDALDRAEASIGRPSPQRTWSVWVRFLRWAMHRRTKRRK